MTEDKEENEIEIASLEDVKKVLEEFRQEQQHNDKIVLSDGIKSIELSSTRYKLGVLIKQSKKLLRGLNNQKSNERSYIN